MEDLSSKDEGWKGEEFQLVCHSTSSRPIFLRTVFREISSVCKLNWRVSPPISKIFFCFLGNLDWFCDSACSRPKVRRLVRNSSSFPTDFFYYLALCGPTDLKSKEDDAVMSPSSISPVSMPSETEHSPAGGEKATM